LQAGDCTGRH